MMPYVELHSHSAYSFLDGASQPEELAVRAAELGYEAFALTDHDGVYGSLEFAHAAKPLGVRPITGAEVTLTGGAHVTLLVESPRGYANLCRLLTEAHAGTRPKPTDEPSTALADVDKRARGSASRPASKPALPLESLLELREGLVCLSGCARHGLAGRDPAAAARLAAAFGPERFYVELQRPYERGDTRRNARLRALAETLGVHVVATGDPHAHHPRRLRLQDVLVAIANRTSLDGCERERRGNHESVLLSPAEMAERLPRDAVERTVEVAARLQFDLTQELGYRYPDFSDGDDPADVQLARICDRAFADRYGTGRSARERLDEELALIGELGLSGFFLLHWEVLELARACALEVRGPGSPRHALPPGRGRGSSVGSIVCYLTGLSHVDPVANNLSLGRFLNKELVAVPDIDLDFPRDIREKLIVRVIERYGNEHASLVAAFPTYRARGAIRDVGKALGLPFAELERLARLTEGSPRLVADEIAKLPGNHSSPRWQALGELAAEIGGLPRHISQHPGGMVISTRPLVELVPVQPAAMAGRQIVQWDKDSCDDAGFLKIDLLGLGMLSAVEDCIDQIARLRATPIDLSRIPLDDKAVYAEIQRADTVGDFQIESRAQMQSLLRTRPENLDDLTIQVALVRPGPIQGKAVHPYIDHRNRLREDPAFVWPVDHELLREPLRETLGVVVFQDQVLAVAQALAGFSIGEAEGLRRAMSRKRSVAAIEAYRERFVEGAAGLGVDRAAADAVYDKLVGFSGFGFPKSHAAAFGLLAYQSAWLRHHYPPEFLCALLNAQPMGFYPPASLVRDAQRRGVEVRPPDLNLSTAKCSLEPRHSSVTVPGTVTEPSRTVLDRGAAEPSFEPRHSSVTVPGTVTELSRTVHSVRIGLGYIRGVGTDDAEAVVAGQPYADVSDLARRAAVDKGALEALVAAGACDAFGQRRQLLWRLGATPRGAAVRGGHRQLALPLEATAETPELPEQTAWEKLLADYRHTTLSVGVHPLQLLRPHLDAEVCSTDDLLDAPHESIVAVAGMAIARQRPATANGTVFMLLEDEFGQVNLIVQPHVYEAHRALVRGEPLLLARGRYERHGANRNVLVARLESLAPLARRVSSEAEIVSALPQAHHFGHR
jgi:error-prone DNA polymerase